MIEDVHLPIYEVKKAYIESSESETYTIDGALRFVSQKYVKGKDDHLPTHLHRCVDHLLDCYIEERPKDFLDYIETQQLGAELTYLSEKDQNQRVDFDKVSDFHDRVEKMVESTIYFKITGKLADSEPYQAELDFDDSGFFDDSLALEVPEKIESIGELDQIFSNSLEEYSDLEDSFEESFEELESSFERRYSK